MPLTPEHQDVYEDFLTRLLSAAEKRDFTRNALGRYVLEMLQSQAVALKSAKAGTGEPFDTLDAAKSVIFSLNENATWMSKKGDAFCVELKKDFELLSEAFDNKRRHSWMTDHGKFLLQRALDIQPVVGREAAMFPLRTRALRGTLITVYDALAADTNVSTWKIALETALSSYENYRFDFCTLTRLDGHRFLRQNQLVAKMVQDIDERIVTITQKAAAKAAETVAAARAEAEAEADDEVYQRDSRHGSGVAYARQEHQPVEPYENPAVASTPTEPDPNYWDNWESDYNPANGLPMVGCLDVRNNAWGTNYNEF